MVEIISECGINHNGSMWLAKELIRESKNNGADVAKFQIYEVDTILTKDFKWYDFCKHAQLTKEQVALLMDECDDVGIEFLASIFSADRVKWTEELGMKRYKIASRNNFSSNDCERELIDAIANTGKDIIFSLGQWTERELPVINTTGKVNFLYCISKYPTMPEDIDWNEFSNSRYDGFSDHTIGIEATKKVMDLGVKIVEKHFTMDKNMFGPDHSGSMEPHELKELVNYAKGK